MSYSMDCSPPGSSVHRIFQARTLEWVAISPSRGSSWPRDRTPVFCIGRQVLYYWATYEALVGWWWWCSGAKLCPTLFNPVNCNTPDFPAPHHLPKFVKSHVHWVSDAIHHLILCHPLLLLPSIFLWVLLDYIWTLKTDIFFTSHLEDSSLIPGLGRSPGEGIGYLLQYSWASLVAQLVKNPPAVQETWVWSLGWEDPLEKRKTTHSSILAWRIPWTV